MADLIPPASLPRPQTSVVTPAERRILSDQSRPRDARAAQRDRTEFERLTFPALTQAQAAAFDTWWRDDLVYGGAWFTAKWPLPRGFVNAVRKFIETPKFEFVGDHMNGRWRVSVLTEVRGLGVAPQEIVEVVALSTGWSDSVFYQETIAHANSGTYDVESNPTVLEFLDFYAGIADYVSGTVDWTLVWAPVSGDPAPEMTELTGGYVRLRFTNTSYPFQNTFGAAGLATLTATVDGAPTDSGVEIAVTGGDFGYGFFSWHPVP